MTVLLGTILLAGCGSHGGAANSQTTNQSASGRDNSSDGTNDVDPVYGHLLHAQPRLRTVKVWLGAEELTAEVAVRPIEIATGMMFRTNLLENEAMLFVFPDVGPRSFYMRNCTVPLTAAYINPDGVIQEFARLDPGDTNGVPSRSWNIQYVLELPQGWHERHNIRTGAVVRTDRGSLRETFFRQN
jgi:uncharacterized membrane protein (UPF0127 family)